MSTGGVFLTSGHWPARLLALIIIKKIYYTHYNLLARCSIKGIQNGIESRATASDISSAIEIEAERSLSQRDPV